MRPKITPAPAEAERIVARFAAGTLTPRQLAAEWGADVSTAREWIRRVVPAGVRAAVYRKARLGRPRGKAVAEPVGTVRVKRPCGTRAAYRVIKVRADGPRGRRWVALARVVYEARYGPIPAGHRVEHRTADTLDDSIGNLVLASMADVGRRQTRSEKRIAAVRRAARRRGKLMGDRAALAEIAAAKRSADLPPADPPPPEPRTAAERARQNVAEFIRQLGSEAA